MHFFAFWYFGQILGQISKLESNLVGGRLKFWALFRDFATQKITGQSALGAQRQTGRPHDTFCVHGESIVQKESILGHKFWRTGKTRFRARETVIWGLKAQQKRFWEFWGYQAPAIFYQNGIFRKILKNFLEMPNGLGFFKNPETLQVFLSISYSKFQKISLFPLPFLFLPFHFYYFHFYYFPFFFFLLYYL